MIIGICGKTTLANQITKLTFKKVLHLGIDKIGHKALLLPKVIDKLIDCFGILLLKLILRRK